MRLFVLQRRLCERVKPPTTLLLLLSQSLTAGRGDDGLQLPLFTGGGQRERHGQHGAEGGAHVQAGGQGAVALADKGVAEVEGGDGLARLLVDAGDAGGA